MDANLDSVVRRRQRLHGSKSVITRAELVENGWDMCPCCRDVQTVLDAREQE